MDPVLTALGAFAVSAVSALSQVLPVEAYLVGLGLVGAGTGVWLVAVLAGIGHGVGKLAWYEVGRAAYSWDRFRRWLDRPRVQATYVRWLEAFDRRPRLALLMMGASSLLGFPPLGVTPTIAGQLGLGRTRMVVIVAAGRTLRFAALLGVLRWLGPST